VASDRAPGPAASPPVAERRPVTTEHHGRTRVDDYEWLRDKGAPEVTAYLEAENAYTQARTEHLAGLRQAIFDEIKGRTRETDLSVPTRNRGHWYYGRSFEGREYGASCRVPVTDPDDWTPPRPAEDCAPDQPALPGEQLLLDLDAMAEGHEFFSLGGSSISPDSNLLAYSTDVVGDERYTIRVLELDTREHRPDEIVGAIGGATWDPSGEHLYYTTVDESWRSDKIWRHTLGTAQADDVLVHHEEDGRFFVGVGRSRSDRFVIIAAGSKITSEYRFLDSQHPEAGFQVFSPRREGLEYSLDHAVIGGEDVFLVLHNHTGANFEIATAPVAPTGPEDWAPLVAHDPAVRLEDVDAFAGHLVVHQRSQGLTQLRIIELGQGPDRPAVGDDYLVEFDHEVYTVGSGGNPTFAQPTVRLGYTTMAVPSSVYDYDVRTRELTLLRRAPVLGGYDPDDYEEHRLWATAEDGEQVPISIVCRRGSREDPSRLADPHLTTGEGGGTRPVPTLLYGYGAYEASMDPYFSVARLSLLDRGAAFAIAHVRGGGEMGRRWYDDGKLLKKQHTFSDFIACARHLVDTGWSAPQTLVAEGASAGGLLAGAVANQAPELFGGIVAGVPFVDNLTTMLDASLPLTVTEYDEWGNPEADPEVFDYIASYAPYDNVAAATYPPILAETSLNDTRVLYVEPAKWVAKLRATALNGEDVLLRTEMSAGHGGVSGRYKAWHDRAFALAWILDRMGLADVAPSPSGGAAATNPS
jgi:oligopeptidase B